MTAQIDEMKRNADDIRRAVRTEGPSVQVSTEDILRRSLLIAAASYFEHEFGQSVSRVFSQQSCSIECLELIRNKAIERQFSTYFDFGASNTNRLFGMFGKDCSRRASEAIRDDLDLLEAQEAFLLICATRNRMVHNNFIGYAMDMTTDEVYEKFKQGSKFLPFFERVISNASGAEQDSEAE